MGLRRFLRGGMRGGWLRRGSSMPSSVMLLMSGYLRGESGFEDGELRRV